MNSHLFDSCLVSVNNNVALPKVDIKPSFWMTSKTATIYAYIHACCIQGSMEPAIKVYVHAKFQDYILFLYGCLDSTTGSGGLHYS